MRDFRVFFFGLKMFKFKQCVLHILFIYNIYLNFGVIQSRFRPANTIRSGLVWIGLSWQESAHIRKKKKKKNSDVDTWTTASPATPHVRLHRTQVQHSCSCVDAF